MLADRIPDSDDIESREDDLGASDEATADQPLTTEEVLGWTEFACWVTLVLAPTLYYVNGPSVSTDQAVVRTVLVVLSCAGAVALRWVNWRRARQAKLGEDQES